MTPEQTFVIAIVTAVMTSIATPIITGWWTHRKNDADADVSNAEAVEKIVKGGGEAVDTAMKLLEKYEKRNNELQAQIDELTRQVKKLTDKMDVSRKHIDYLESTLEKNKIEFHARPNELLDTGDRLKKANP
jgi:peptidoglycan hydrolase CwlO-like protein